MERRTRRVAALVLLGVLVAAAGCSALGLGGGSQTNLLLVNNDNEAHDEVTVEIMADGDQQFSATASPSAESNVELGSFGGTGEYTLLVTVDGRETRLSYEFASDDDTVSIGIDNQGNVFVG
jgi:hypothetical protein